MAIETPPGEIGSLIPTFTLPDANGKMYSSDSLIGERGILVAFICNHCPYVKAIAGQLSATASFIFHNKINTVAIMANDWSEYPEDAPEQMVKFANINGFDFPYLVDKTQAVAKSFGAVCTPDFFGYNKDGQLQYRGRLNSAKDMSNAEVENELLNAMQMISDINIGPEVQQPSIGCSIKWRK